MSTVEGPTSRTRLSFGSGTYASKTGLRIADGALATFEEWLATGRRMGMLVGASAWWLGDWLRYGQANQEWGHRYEEAIEVIGLDYGTMRNYRFVVGRFDYRRRRDDLSFSHHYEVAALTPGEQDEWLDRAAAEGWSHKELREQLRAARELPAAPPDPTVEPVEQVRLTWPVERIERWKAKAGEAGLSYTDWVGKTCDEAAA